MPLDSYRMDLSIDEENDPCIYIYKTEDNEPSFRIYIDGDFIHFDIVDDPTQDPNMSSCKYQQNDEESIAMQFCNIINGRIDVSGYKFGDGSDLDTIVVLPSSRME